MSPLVGISAPLEARLDMAALLGLCLYTVQDPGVICSDPPILYEKNCDLPVLCLFLCNSLSHRSYPICTRLFTIGDCIRVGKYSKRAESIGGDSSLQRTHMLRYILTTGDYMTKVDLKDAYFMTPCAY